MHFPGAIGAVALTCFAPLAVATLAGCLAGCGGADGATDAGAAAESADLSSHVYSSCPNELAGANGAACKSAGLGCTYGIECGAWTQDVHCTCEGGHFVCADAKGTLEKGEAARCGANDPGPDPDPCPASKVEAAGAACNVLGRACFYEGAICPESVTGKPRLDDCECTRGADGTLAFVCPLRQCNPLFQPGDAPLATGSSERRDAGGPPRAFR